MDELDDAIRGLEQLARDLDDLAAQALDPVHDAILAQMRAQASQIPRDSGALRRSLTDPSDRTHVYERRGRTLRYGSTLPQAASPYVAPRIPTPSAQAIARVVADKVVTLAAEALS